MECRKGCGACCIAPSISSPLPGLPFGKMPGDRCPHLNDMLQCSLIDDDNRPDACRKFLADEDEHRSFGSQHESQSLRIKFFKEFVRKITQTAINISEKY